LRNFHKDTDASIRSIPRATNTPAFLSRDIPKRFKLGKAAAKLADKLDESFQLFGVFEELSQTDEAQALEAREQ
jgi:hypothetical protein